ncbi:hypothetical protein ACJMK2_036691 [Sinanodonta woodiana]|uniref:Uncharacterized protein n=1 Tax=Sinanodonta woodiana TaxID=1069815 RepID=A0ABD3WIC7_SINWO
MQIQDLTVGDETLVDVAPLSDLPDPLSESSVSFGMPADLEGTFIGKEKDGIVDLSNLLNLKGQRVKEPKPCGHFDSKRSG